MDFPLLVLALFLLLVVLLRLLLVLVLLLLLVLLWLFALLLRVVSLCVRLFLSVLVDEDVLLLLGEGLLSDSRVCSDR